MNENTRKWVQLGASIVAGVMATLGVILLLVAPEQPIARGTSFAGIYRSAGGDTLEVQSGGKVQVESGGELEIQSGATFDLQSGATVDFSGGVDLDGSQLKFDADGDTLAQASDDDIITYTVNLATGYIVVTTGNLRVGNGTPSTAQDGEDAYVEGGFEVDGTANFDGPVTIDGGLTDIGGGSYATADADNDLGVAGDLEVEGVIQLGSDGVYPLGYASSAQEMVCGTTSTFTGSLEVTPSGLTTVTYVTAIQVTNPTTTALVLSSSDPTTSTFALYSWTATSSTGTTGVTAHYCAVGNE